MLDICTDVVSGTSELTRGPEVGGLTSSRLRVAGVGRRVGHCKTAGSMYERILGPQEEIILFFLSL